MEGNTMTMQNHNRTASCCQQDSQLQSTVLDPVCGMTVTESSGLRHTFKGKDYSFCSKHCLQAFSTNPEKYLYKKSTENHSQKPSLLIGMGGALVLLSIFFTIVFLANGSLESAWQEFQRLWYWVLTLASGFGLQLGLFFHIRNSVSEQMPGATAEVAASGTISTGSMIACCSHGLINLLPILGVSVAAAFLAQYQLPLILFGVVSNLIGITIMLGIMQKHHVLPRNSMARRVVGINMKLTRIGIIIIGLIVIAVSIFYA